MKSKLIRVLVLLLIAAMIASLVAMASGKMDAVYFWVIMAAGAMAAYLLKRRK